MYQRCTAFSFVVQLFNSCTAFQKYIYEDHRICTALEITVHFGTNTIVNEIKSQIQCTKDVQLFLWLYSFSIVVQLSENIYMRTTEFVQLWKKLYIFVQTSLWMKLRAKYSVPKMYSFFFGCTAFQLLYSFLKIYIWGPQNLYSFGKNCTFWYKHHCEWN